MTDLAPCLVCQRHVAIDETSCPFCAAAQPMRSPVVEPRARLCRAAVFVAGVATLAMSSGCGSPRSEPKHVEQTAAAVDAAVSPPDAAMPPDAALRPDAPVAEMRDPDDRRFQRHPCVKTEKGVMCAPYGAPPARRRVV